MKNQITVSQIFEKNQVLTLDLIPSLIGKKAEQELRKRYPNLRILSIQSESFGLNLQEYDTIIIWDKVWDYALIKQMEHRIWRTGQTNICRFVNLNGNVGLEKLILDNINKKQNLLDYFKTTALKEAIQEL